jgi:hypothetical protein
MAGRKSLARDHHRLPGSERNTLLTIIGLLGYVQLEYKDGVLSTSIYLCSLLKA